LNAPCGPPVSSSLGVLATKGVDVAGVVGQGESGGPDQAKARPARNGDLRDTGLRLRDTMERSWPGTIVKVCT